MTDGALFCGSNRPVGNVTTFDKIYSAVMKSGVSNLPTVEIIYGRNFVRDAVPYIYYPQLDYSDGEGYAKVGFNFLDNDEFVVEKFKLYQLYDKNPFFRLTGNRNCRFCIDKTDQGEVFRMEGLDNYRRMDKDTLDAIESQFPGVIIPYMNELQQTKMTIRDLIRKINYQELEISTLHADNDFFRGRGSGSTNLISAHQEGEKLQAIRSTTTMGGMSPRQIDRDVLDRGNY